MAGVADVAEAAAHAQRVTSACPPLPTPTWVCPHGRVLCDCHHAAPDYSDVLERIATALNRIADAQESRKPRVSPMGFMRDG